MDTGKRGSLVMLKVFIDTNIIISGIFFSGLESKILDSRDLRLVTADICREETMEVVKRKFNDLGSKSLDKVLEEVEEALMDIEFIKEEEYRSEMDFAKKCVRGENDIKVLAAVIAVEPDHFITGDSDFHKEEVEEKVDLITSRELLDKIR
ncbi:MAG: putative toxin-antitoxin system toxin component, PIN family [Candidatus Saliniplasma sp.]